MPHPRRCSTLLLIGLVPALSALDSVPSKSLIRVMPAAWFASANGEMGYVEGSGKAKDNLVDLDDLDLGGTRVAPMVEAWFNPPLFFDFSAGLFLYGADSEATLDKTVQFGTHAYAAGTQVDTTLDMTHVYVEMSGRPLDFDLGGFSAGLALHMISAKGTLKSAAISDDFDQTAYVPTLALRGFVNPTDSVGLEARVHWMALDLFGVEASFLDVSAQVTWLPLDVLGIAAGWRLIDQDLSFDLSGADELKADLTINGPYVGGVLRF